MSGIAKIEVRESTEELKSLMKQQKTGLGYAKVQSLYLLKIRVAENINYLAVIIGRGESTIHRWLQLYKKGGLSLLLEEPPKTGRPKKIDIETGRIRACSCEARHEPFGFPPSFKENYLSLKDLLVTEKYNYGF